PAGQGGAATAIPGAAPGELGLPFDVPVRPRPDSAKPLTAQLSRLHITVSRRFLEKLDAARAALSHTHPHGKAETILEAGLDLVLARHATRRGFVKKPRPAKWETPSE